MRNKYKSLRVDSENNKKSDSKDSILDASVDNRFKNNILTLRNYLFISLTTNVIIFKIYRLV